jgi:two-component system, NarL family, invasion response regulator UvrY
MALILLVEDDAIYQTVLKDMIAEEFPQAKVEAAKTGAEALSLIEKTDYDVIVLDLRLSDIHGVEVFREIKKLGKTAPVLFLTAYLDDSYVDMAMRMGAYGFFHKMHSEGEPGILDGIRRALEGAGPALISAARESLNDLEHGREPLHLSLTKAERALLVEICNGHSVKNAASVLGIAASTAYQQLASIRKKLEVENNQQIVCYALRHRLVRFAEEIPKLPTCWD